MAAQIGAAALILLTYSWTTITLAIASLAIVAAYPFAKRFTWWPQLVLGLAFNWGVLVAYAAHAGAPGWPVLALYAAGIGWTALL